MAQKEGKTVHLATLMDFCHLKNSELDKKVQSYKGRVVLRGDVVKDESGSYAVFIQQGSSASHMSASKVVDVISRLPGYAGRASDAVSSYAHVKNRRRSKVIGITGIRVPSHLDSSTTIPP